MTPLKNLLDKLRGTGSAAVTIPSMDGPLKANNLLDKAPVFAEIASPCDLALRGNDILTSSAGILFALRRASVTSVPAVVSRFNSDITSLSSHRSGLLAVGLEDGSIHLMRPGSTERETLHLTGPKIPCITAMAFGDADTLFVCSGSKQNPKSGWKRDLMSRNSSGSVWRIDLVNGSHDCLADGLAFPYGVLPRSEGLVIAESWKHRLLIIEPGRKPRQAIDDLPGYPARLAPSSGGDFWMPLFAPRRQMVEFVLRERAYCERMMKEIPEQYWMAPSVSSGQSYLEPLQGGAIRQLGVLKPWAPTRSYGLLIRMNTKFEVVSSLHSRADGQRHGITTCLDLGGIVVAASEGSNAIISIELDFQEGGLPK